MSYTAIVCKIKLSNHPNANALQIGSVSGHNVIVGMDTRQDEIGIFFPCDGQLSESFADSNNLVGYTDEKTGEKKGGFFPKNRRVRALSLRGEKSDGFYCPLSFLKNCGVSEKTINNLKEGDQFTSLDEVLICQKYVTPATLKAISNKEKNSSQRKENKLFAEHFDTKQFKYEVDKIPENSILYITSKCHGSSGRYALLLDNSEVPLSKFKQLLNKIGFNFKPKIEKQYQHLIGSRRVILHNEKSEFPGFYGSNQFRKDVGDRFIKNLKKGEIVYGEIVGWLPGGTSIMPSVSVKSLKNKELTKKYGDTMYFKYGQPQGNCNFLVYRITRVNEDGDSIDLSWAEVKKRSSELGLETVPELFGPVVYNRDFDKDKLTNLVNELVQGEDIIDPSHIREGVCVRVENKSGINILKSKSHLFLTLEGIIKDDENYLDIEEAQE